MRVTIGMISSQYRSNLNSALGSLNYYNNRATTLSKFSKVSEDPVAAAQSFRLRREYQDNTDFQSGVRDVENQFLTTESSIMAVNTIVQEALGGDCLKGITGTTGSDGRDAISKKLKAMQNSLLSTVNGKFADRYLFGGSNASQPPFTVSETGDLLFRGANVENGKLENGPVGNYNAGMVEFGKAAGDKLNGYTLQVVKGTAGSPSSAEVSGNTITVTMDIANSTNRDFQTALQGLGLNVDTGVDFSQVKFSGNLDAKVMESSTSITDTVKLNDLANEKIFVDLGLGLKVGTDGVVNPQSAFDVSMPGIKFLGFGETADGIPKNLYTLMGKMADELVSSNYSNDKMIEYMSVFEAQGSQLMTSVTEIGVKSNFLTNMKEKLTENEINLTVKLKDIEQIDPAMAIMDFKMQEYAYNAALQMGTKILQPTFLDFMR